MSAGSQVRVEGSHTPPRFGYATKGLVVAALRRASSGETRFGATQFTPPPIMFDEDTGELDRAPDIGEHTAEILSELGIEADQIERLRQERVAI